MKKFLAILLTLMMVFTIATPAYAAMDKEDVQTSVGEIADDNSFVGKVTNFFVGIIESIHNLLHNIARKVSIKCPFCGKRFIVAKPGAVEDAFADAKSGDTIEFEAGEYGAITLGSLEGIILEGKDGVDVDSFITTAETSLKDVTIKGFDLDVAASGESCMVIDATAVIENLVIEDVTFTGPVTVKNCYGIKGNNTSATMTVKNCTFDGTGYALYSTGKGGYAELTVENCAFNDIYSWVILVQYGFLGDLTITGCTFNACEDGISKNGSFDAAKTFTFTNNTVADNCAGHDGKDSKWFELKTATAVIEGNTFGGAEWIPGDAQGIKPL